MPHIDEDELAVIALGEPASPADDRHLQECARCRSRLDQLSAVVATTRSVKPADLPVAPPASVWAGIEAELGLAGQSAGGSVRSLDEARRGRSRGWTLAAIAAAVGLLAGSVGTVLLSQREASPVIVAEASLEPVDAATVRGTAAIERTDGAAVLHVTVPGLPTLDDGYYEVWMATPDAGTMVAIGTLNPGEEGTFVLPAGMDVAAFPLVDVSVEHFDGDAGHSAVSVVRGQLPA